MSGGAARANLRATFFATSRVAFAVAARDGRLVDHNDAFAAIAGAPGRDLRGTSIADHIHPDDRDATLVQFAKAADEGDWALAWVNRYGSAERGWRTVRWTTWVAPDEDLMCGIAHDITGEQEAATQLSKLAYQDQLTGLANRALLFEAIDAAILSHEPDGAMAALFLDVDGFKAVNDAHGHAVGDALLREVGVRLRRAVRRTDVAARLGGDEFVVVLTGLPLDRRAVREAVARACAELTRALAEPFVAGEVRARLGCSIGAAAWPWSGSDAQALLTAADGAMYAAKRDGAVSCALDLALEASDVVEG